jgi:Na+/melibiose symporter-like transporter
VAANDSWAGTAKAVCLRTLSTGKFGQLGFFAISGVLIYKIESPHWVELFKTAVNAWQFQLLGWVLWIGTVLISLVLFRIIRERYQAEINRLVEIRNGLQELLSKGTFQSSRLEDKK